MKQGRCTKLVSPVSSLHKFRHYDKERVTFIEIKSPVKEVPSSSDRPFGSVIPMVA